MTNKNIPEIRFPGFTEEWEQRKLGEYAEILTGGTPKTSISEYWEPKKIPWMSSGEVNKRRLDGTDNMISEEGLNNSSARWVKKHSVLIALAGQGKTRGTVAVNNIELTTNQSIAAIVPNNDLHYEFIYQNLIKRYEELRIISSGDGTRGGLNKQIVSDVIIPSPIKNEQMEIGTFFKQLDDMIDLHQRELELLKETKKGFLQKMFPKEGEKVPEIRFPGFTEEWEQRKAKEIFVPTVDKNQPELPVLSVTQDSGVVYRDQLGIDIKYDKTTLKNYKVVHQGDFIISLRSFQGGFELSDKLGITSPAYTVFIPKNINNQDSLFWKVKFKTFTFIESLKTVTFGIRDGKSISFSEFGDLKLLFPKNIEEQQKIGTFFKQLDDTIALHQRELDLLKETKKGFLQKLFV
ncbi:restriction endonuclease subunit S [Enterococcus sp. DIV0385]|jgi:type I restriction enzyme S subunit|uniref:restriction endonuclease subunit S n=1 Tax=unclassified Enterococcus TaxID=2608891 RepID=UPI000A354497|nr:hsdSIB [Bacillales bacterium]OTO97248.1 hypothetical protein A5852_003224 [Enterococcus faecium]